MRLVEGKYMYLYIYIMHHRVDFLCTVLFSGSNCLGSQRLASLVGPDLSPKKQWLKALAPLWRF